MADNVFVIGDTHGHLDRLEALLKQEGILERCVECDGGGGDDPLTPDCWACQGEGTRRMREDVTVVHLGDLGHFGHRGSPTGDMLCYKHVTVNRWCDVVLWGNHDRAAIDGSHHATDFMQVPEALHYIKRLWEEGRMQVAFAAHGFLITHAGLAAAFEQQKLPDHILDCGEGFKEDPQAVADWLNDQDEIFLEHDQIFPDQPPQADESAVAVINAIGRTRGGHAPTGGILWRDIEEKLYDGFRQIFGHSADPRHQVRYGDTVTVSTRGASSRCSSPGSPPLAYCIDIGGKGEMPGDPCLAGIWLPSEKIVRVDL